MFLMVMEKGKQEQMKLGRAVPDNRDACPERYGLGGQGTRYRGGKGVSCSIGVHGNLTSLLQPSMSLPLAPSCNGRQVCMADHSEPASLTLP